MFEGHCLATHGSVYLDHAATTPSFPEVVDVMLPYLRGAFGNPSGLYGLAIEARDGIDTARRQVAAVLGCRPNEVIFTSGGTESINTALKGVGFALKLAGAGDEIITSSVEHHAVLHTCQYLEKFGFQVTVLPVDAAGLVSPETVASAISERTALVSIMYANNEVGTVQPIEEIARSVRERATQLGKHIPFHTDAVQAPGALDLNVERLGVDLLSLSSHKFGGPKGSGVLYLRRWAPFLAQQTGGGQERQRRAGTENVAGIAGTGLALALTVEAQERTVPTLRKLRDRLIDGILARVPGAVLNGPRERRLPGNVNISFDGIEGEALLAALDKAGIAASSGSACASLSWEPSHVLVAMGATLDRASSALRLSLGHGNTDEDVDYVLEVLPGIISRLRATPATSPA
jgi:cysteine desulfurase